MTGEPEEKKQWQQVMLRMPPKLHAQLKAQADLEERSMAYIVRRALRWHVKRSESKQ